MFSILAAGAGDTISVNFRSADIIDDGLKISIYISRPRSDTLCIKFAPRDVEIMPETVGENGCSIT